MSIRNAPMASGSVPHHVFHHAASSPLIDRSSSASTTTTTTTTNAAATTAASPATTATHHHAYLIHSPVDQLHHHLPPPSAPTSPRATRSRSPLHSSSVHKHPNAKHPSSSSSSALTTTTTTTTTSATSSSTATAVAITGGKLSSSTISISMPAAVITTDKLVPKQVNGKRVYNQYEIGESVGKGQHGQVYVGYDINNNRKAVAIKVCKRRNPREAKVEQLRLRNQTPIPRSPALTGNGLLAAAASSNDPYAVFNGVSKPSLVAQLQVTEKKVLREIAIMKKCRHGQIVQLFEIINDVQESKIFLVMEYMGGGEIKWRDERGRPCLRVDQSRRICRDVVLGLEYLHYQGIVHRDIKPANLLWTSDRKNVKITDFGVSHFSAPQRIEALRRSKAYLEAFERTKRERRGRTRGGRDDVKHKGKGKQAQSQAADLDDDASIEAEVLRELVGDLDPILLDDGGLSRQAGTPSFLAPEIIWEFGSPEVLHKRKMYTPSTLASKSTIHSEGGDAVDGSSSISVNTPRRATSVDDRTPSRPPVVSSDNSGFFHVSDPEETAPDPDPRNFHDPNVNAVQPPTSEKQMRPRPPITKAIDIWALGVTLYCLLFGRTPWSGQSEYTMYTMIHTEDFKVEDVMGYDRIETGGRRHKDGDESEGAVVMRLLGRLLEKDCSKRITLEEIKRLPWITRDIDDPEAWNRKTSPIMQDPITVTADEEDVAVSSLKFRWKQSWPWRSILSAGKRDRRERAQDEAHARALQARREALDASTTPTARSSVNERSGRRLGKTGGSDALQRKPSRSRRIIDNVERGMRRISRQGSTVYGPLDDKHAASSSTKRLRNRTQPELTRTQSQSREGSRSRPASRASISGLTSPSTAGYASDADYEQDLENETHELMIDDDDTRASGLREHMEGKEPEREREPDRRGEEKKVRTRNSAGGVMRYLSWMGGRSGTDLSESSSGTSFPSFGFGGRKNMSKRSTISDHTGGASFQERKLARRSADEVGRTTRSVGSGRGQVQSFGNVQAAPSKRTITTSGYSHVNTHRALASAEELTTARRASSWGDVAGGLGAAVVGEHDYAYTHGSGHDFGYAASPYGGFPSGQGGGEGEGEDVDEEDFENEYDAGSVVGYGRYGAYGYDYGYGNYGYYHSGPDVDGYASGDAAGEGLDDEVRLVGAGGVLTHSGPISGPSSPNSLSGVSVVVPPVVVGSVSVVNQGAGGVGPTQIICSPPPPSSSGALSSGATLGVGTMGNRPRARSFGQGYVYGGGVNVGGGSSQYYPHHHHQSQAAAHYQQHQHHLSSPLARTPLNLDGELAREFSFDLSTGVPSSMDLEGEQGRRGEGRGRDEGEGERDGEGEGEEGVVYGRGMMRIVDDDAGGSGSGVFGESGGVVVGGRARGGEADAEDGQRGRRRGLYDTHSAEDEGEEEEEERERGGSHHSRRKGRGEGEREEEEEEGGSSSGGESSNNGHSHSCDSSSSVEAPLFVKRRRPSEVLARSMSRTRPSGADAGSRVEVEV